jgi:hypothetical protein
MKESDKLAQRTLFNTAVSPHSHRSSSKPVGRVKLEDEAPDLCVSMPEIERLTDSIAWIGLSFVEGDGLSSGRSKWASGIT